MAIALYYNLATRGYLDYTKHTPDVRNHMHTVAGYVIGNASFHCLIGREVFEYCATWPTTGRPIKEIGCCKPLADACWFEMEDPACDDIRYGVASMDSGDGVFLFLEFISDKKHKGNQPVLRRVVKLGFGVDGSIEHCAFHELDDVTPRAHTWVAIAALAFAHCKNVSLEQVTSINQSAKWHRRMKCPEVQFKTIKIPSVVRGRATSGGSHGESSPCAIHMVRGHFATYTADKPLFGRPDGVGKFWHPQHIRGDNENGIVVKDYKI